MEAPAREGFGLYFRSVGTHFGTTPVGSASKWFLFDKGSSAGLLLLSGNEAALHVLTIDMDHQQNIQVVESTVAQVNETLKVASTQCELDHKWFQFASMPSSQAGTDLGRVMDRTSAGSAAELFNQLSTHLQRTPLVELDPTLDALSSTTLNWRCFAA